MKMLARTVKRPPTKGADIEIEWTPRAALFEGVLDLDGSNVSVHIWKDAECRHTQMHQSQC